MEALQCRIATAEEVRAKMEVEVALHPGDRRWEIWRDEAVPWILSGKRVCYIALLGGTVICEATAALSPDAAQNPEGLIDETTAYLFAFRTLEEYRGRGYFSRLFRFLEEDLKRRGYRRLTVGVEPAETQNLAIYQHWGFTRFLKRAWEEEPPARPGEPPSRVLVDYYAKEI